MTNYSWKAWPRAELSEREAKPPTVPHYSRVFAVGPGHQPKVLVRAFNSGADTGLPCGPRTVWKTSNTTSAESDNRSVQQTSPTTCQTVSGAGPGTRSRSSPSATKDPDGSTEALDPSNDTEASSAADANRLESPVSSVGMTTEALS